MSLSARSKNSVFVLLVGLLFCISYARDTVFILLNACMNHEPNNYANTALPEFLKELPVADLKKIKWIMAIAFSAIFMVITSIAIHLYFSDKQYTRLAVYTYVFLGISVLASELINHIITLPVGLRNIMHAPESLIQSPLVLLLLFSVLKFYPKRAET
jgi:hypothetical protein